ncbi:hypothetical protein DOTSEDRAFT_44091 [Dothistroma septosporum NZE10]|uniref:Uncharacterized protein n=1 Tax=Dothistroma septosporum (strain NZE10 / CBS 128990) TaxID=675120 RepID=N1PU20_DOTSN|nr:hypothetical protein DOTSEDRAFT_44091 [Dothistroma septosporum NZE10]
MEHTLLQQRQHEHTNNNPPYPTAAENMAQHVLGPQLAQAPRSRSRSSSIASRYTPDGYPARGSAEMPRSEDYLTPYRRPSNTEMVLHQSSPPSRPQSSGSGYNPSVPEQYHAPQQTGRSLPPAQLGMTGSPLSSSPRISSDGYDRPARPRFVSSGSHRSAHSHRSSHHRRHSHETKQERRERQGREGRAVSVPRNHDLNEDYTLTRRDTPRGYGSSLWSIFDGVKKAWRN